MESLLDNLLQGFGPCGNEEGIAKVIKNEISKYVDEFETDALGNLIAHKFGNGPRLMFCVPMDMLSFIITYIGEDGLLRFGQMGSASASDLKGRLVRFQNGMKGVIESKEASPKAVSDMFIDIGADTKDEADKSIRLGDLCVLDLYKTENNGKIIASGLGNRAGCAALIDGIRRINDPCYDLYFVFTVQSEVGNRGAKPVVYRIQPDVGITVNVCNIQDSFSVGSGAGIKLMDGCTFVQTEVVSWMRKCAENKNIAVQEVVAPLHRAETGILQSNMAGIYAGGIEIPCRYQNGIVGIAAYSDLENAGKLIAALAESELYCK